MADGNKHKESFMKITVIPTGNAPTHYSFDGEVITAHYDGETESFDLSVIPADGEFKGVLADTVNLPSSQIVRDAYRDSAGELHVTLCQGVGAGHWIESEVLDSVDYDPYVVYVRLNKSKQYAGIAEVMTKAGAE
jgi:hypothetical protein